MKQINIIKKLFIPLTIIGVGAFISCDDAKNDVLSTHAYIEEALSNTSKKVTVQPKGESLTDISVHLSNTSSIDNHYELITDPTILERYNKANGTLYSVLPQSAYTLPGDIIVKAGEYATTSVPIFLKAFTPEMSNSGESYALPLKLKLKNGDVEAMSETGSFVILAENILEFSAPMFDGGADLKANKFKESPETYAQYTVEVRFQVSNTRDRDRAVFKNGGDNLNFVLLRFEDPQSNNDQHQAHSLVQIVGRNRIYLNPSNSFEPNKWQHLALVCDGSNYRLYINGKDSGVIPIPTGPTTFSDVNWFCKGDDPYSRWRGCKILMSEARIWSVARTANQIQNNMTVTSPKSPGLEAYWKFNEGKGNVFQDATGKGHTLTTSITPKWINGILSTDGATEWK